MSVPPAFIVDTFNNNPNKDVPISLVKEKWMIFRKQYPQLSQGVSIRQLIRLLKLQFGETKTESYNGIKGLELRHNHEEQLRPFLEKSKIRHDSFRGTHREELSQQERRRYENRKLENVQEPIQSPQPTTAPRSLRLVIVESTPAPTPAPARAPTPTPTPAPTLPVVELSSPESVATRPSLAHLPQPSSLAPQIQTPPEQSLANEITLEESRNSDEDVESDDNEDNEDELKPKEEIIQPVAIAPAPTPAPTLAPVPAPVSSSVTQTTTFVKRIPPRDERLLMPMNQVLSRATTKARYQQFYRDIINWMERVIEI